MKAFVEERKVVRLLGNFSWVGKRKRRARKRNPKRTRTRVRGEEKKYKYQDLAGLEEKDVEEEHRVFFPRLSDNSIAFYYNHHSTTFLTHLAIHPPCRPTRTYVVSFSSP